MTHHEDMPFSHVMEGCSNASVFLGYKKWDVYSFNEFRPQNSGRNCVPFVYGKCLTNNQHIVVIQAIIVFNEQMLESNINLTTNPLFEGDFEKYKFVTDYLYFKNGKDVMNSFVGRQGGKQVINVWKDPSIGDCLHEIGHAIGLEHEHQRIDRRDYLPKEICEYYKKKGRKDPTNYSVDEKLVLLTKFDKKSIMNYGSQSMKFSKLDLVSIRSLYGSY